MMVSFNQKEEARKNKGGSRDNEFNYEYLAHGIQVVCMEL